MDSWKPEDPKVLEYDLNACTMREFCDVFAVESSTARNLEEYRSEILYILKFEQLLKLKGISEEILQQWQDPKPTQDFDQELQRALNLQVDSPEPLPNLLEALCKLTGASACLMSARKNSLCLKSITNGSTLENLALEIPSYVCPVYENLLQMKQAYPDMQVIGFESGDVLFLPTSGFYLIAMQPAGKLDHESLKWWRALAAEIRRRYPPKIYIEKHASVTETDIAFDCPSCHLRMVVDRAGAGCNLPCPRCKTQVTVPDQTTSFSSYISPEQKVTSVA